MLNFYQCKFLPRSIQFSSFYLTHFYHYHRLQNLIENSKEIRNHDSGVRQLLVRQGDVWLQKQIPFDFVALLGNEYLDAVKPFFHDQVGPSLAIKLEKSLAYLYREAMHFIMQPLVIDRNLRNKASAFYEDLAAELNWSKQVLQKRMVEVNLEIDATGTYTQTTQEIEIGARLAWRNSGKCIGRWVLDVKIFTYWRTYSLI